MDFESFSSMIEGAGICVAGSYPGWISGSPPPIELTVSPSQWNKFEKLVMGVGGYRLKCFFDCRTQGGRYPQYDDKARFWIRCHSKEDLYEQLQQYLSDKRTAKDFDARGDYTPDARRRLRKCGFNPRPMK